MHGVTKALPARRPLRRRPGRRAMTPASRGNANTGSANRRRLLGVIALVWASLAVPDPALRAQTSPELLQALQRGGGWVRLDIQDGAGSFESLPVPTLGIRLRGHLRIWEEHSGSWQVTLRDLARGEDFVILEGEMTPGEPVDFDYQTGIMGQLQLDVRWSEGRDTTLLTWIGTEPPGSRREPTVQLSALTPRNGLSRDGARAQPALPAHPARRSSPGE